MTSSPINSVHNFQFLHGVLFLQHFNFRLRPSISPANDQLVIFHRHAVLMHAEPVFKSVEADFDDEPVEEVLEG